MRVFWKFPRRRTEYCLDIPLAGSVPKKWRVLSVFVLIEPTISITKAHSSFLIETGDNKV
jgi:hypothetical protein